MSQLASLLAAATERPWPVGRTEDEVPPLFLQTEEDIALAALAVNHVEELEALLEEAALDYEGKLGTAASATLPARIRSALSRLEEEAGR